MTSPFFHERSRYARKGVCGQLQLMCGILQPLWGLPHVPYGLLLMWDVSDMDCEGDMWDITSPVRSVICIMGTVTSAW